MKLIIGDFEIYYEWIENIIIDKLMEFVVNEVENGFEGMLYKVG